MINYADTNLSDEDLSFLRYCEFHSETERHLFSRDDVHRLYGMMREEAPRHIPGFVGVDEYQMEEIINTIMIRNSKELWLFPDEQIFSIMRNNS